MKIQKSSEDYLEAMLMIKEKQGYIRSIDIVEQTGVSKPSVSIAVKNLRENGFITVDENHYISLTDSGMEIASRTYEKHKALSEFLIHLGVDEETAREDACKIEHDISEKSFDAICRHANKKRETEKI